MLSTNSFLRQLYQQNIIGVQNMTFNHIMFVVSDMDAALRLWRDLLGFQVVYDSPCPDGEMIDKRTQDTCYGVENVNTHLILLASPEGAVIELQQPFTPTCIQTPKEYLDYAHTGMQECALTVTDIEDWFEKVKAAGYETTTDFIWRFGNITKSFLFRDQDYNLIQLCEAIEQH